MRYSSQVKPNSYLKANAAEVLAQLAEQRQPLVITQNGEAKAVLQDVAAGKVKPVAGASARFEILVTAGAEQDLEAIHDYVCEFDCVANANHLLDALMKVVASLSRFPERGGYPKELVGLGIKEYRQACFKQYRVICRVTGSQVISGLHQLVTPSSLG